MDSMKRFTFFRTAEYLFGEGGEERSFPGQPGKLGGKHGFIISGPTPEQTLGVVGQCEEILYIAGRHCSQHLL